MKTELLHSFSSTSLSNLSRSPSVSTISQNDSNGTISSPTAGLVGGNGAGNGIVGGSEGLGSSSWKYKVTPNDEFDDDQGCFKTWVQRSFTKKNIARKFPILDWLPRYTVSKGVADFIAGLTVGLTLIPQGLAMAAVAQLPPQVCNFTYINYHNVSYFTVMKILVEVKCLTLLK